MCVLQDKLDRVDTALWRQVCFLHSAVMERRKFGSLGWCQTYDFNSGDLTASLAFLEKHFNACTSDADVSWQAVQYMVAEVQYGGRVTDTLDRRLLAQYTAKWLCADIVDPRFCYNPTEGGSGGTASSGPFTREFKYTVRARSQYSGMGTTGVLVEGTGVVLRPPSPHTRCACLYSHTMCACVLIHDVLVCADMSYWSRRHLGRTCRPSCTTSRRSLSWKRPRRLDCTPTRT